MRVSCAPIFTAGPAAFHAVPFHSIQIPVPRVARAGAIVSTVDDASFTAVTAVAESPSGGGGSRVPAVPTACGSISSAVGVAGGYDGVLLPDVPARSPARSFSYGCISVPATGTKTTLLVSTVGSA